MARTYYFKVMTIVNIIEFLVKCKPKSNPSLEGSHFRHAGVRKAGVASRFSFLDFHLKIFYIS